MCAVGNCPFAVQAATECSVGLQGIHLGWEALRHRHVPGAGGHGASFRGYSVLGPSWCPGATSAIHPVDK